MKGVGGGIGGAVVATGASNEMLEGEDTCGGNSDGGGKIGVVIAGEAHVFTCGDEWGSRGPSTGRGSGTICPLERLQDNEEPVAEGGTGRSGATEREEAPLVVAAVLARSDDAGEAL